jgi:hypothetical protein
MFLLLVDIIENHVWAVRSTGQYQQMRTRDGAASRWWALGEHQGRHHAIANKNSDRI